MSPQLLQVKKPYNLINPCLLDKFIVLSVGRGGGGLSVVVATAKDAGSFHGKSLGPRKNRFCGRYIQDTSYMVTGPRDAQAKDSCAC